MSLIDRFEKAAAQHNASRFKRVLFSPWRTLYPEIIQLVANRLDKTFPVNARTFFGQEMKVVLPESVSTSIWRFGMFEEGLTAFILRHLMPGMIFYDVGAHFGFFTLLASHIVGKTGQVHAFEPTRSTFEVLKENTKETRNIFVNQNAMWSQSVSIPFNDYGIAHSAFNSAYDPRFNERDKRSIQADKYEVRAITVDAYADSTGRYPDFIKIDAESAEQEILKGMERTFERTKPIITIEVGDWNIANVSPSGELIRYLFDRGYQVLEFKDNVFRSHVVREKYGYENLFFVHPSNEH